ncbi:MAG: tRNA (cytidine(34)-2'-O)-methyltransferase [Verrucomicrobiae bacterium]|nr:tRNA (cytidine(34)-2'-O)-methyltransferase [Verrucomicrobiae bacterium]
MNVVLVEPEIPPNTGNIARLCAATGATLHLVGPLGFRLDDRQLRRAGLDYWEHVTWRYWENWTAFWEACRPTGQPAAAFYFCETTAARPYTAVQYRWGDYLVFGRETRGLPASVLAAHRDETISIPMWNNAVRSLNLATAVAIVLYEAMRQVRPINA